MSTPGGLFIAALSWLHTYVITVLDSMKIDGAEFLKWLKTEKGKAAFKEAIMALGDKFLAATTPVVEPKPVTFADFPVWKTIRRNPDRKTGDDYRIALHDKGDSLGGIADETIDMICASSEEGEYDLYLMSPRMFGFAQGASQGEFYRAVLTAGFELVPLWVTPELREKYREQPHGNRMVIGIDPVKDDGFLSVFTVGSDSGELWIGKTNGSLGRRWSADAKWVFVKRRTKQAE